MKFNELKILLNEDLFNISYNNQDIKRPKDPFRMMIDFYILNALPKSDDPRIQFEIDESRKELYTYLQKHLLYVLEFAIRDELKHIREQEVKLTDRIKNKAKEYELLTSIFYNSKSYDNFLKNRDKYYEDSVFPLYKLTYIERDLIFQNLGINLSDNESLIVDAIIDNPQTVFSSKYNVVDIMSLGRKMFERLNWFEHYGGKAWLDVVDAYYKLSSAEYKNDGRELAVWIDHVYDLQHNTDTIFNKITLYNTAGISTFKFLLDLKFSAKSLKILYPYASGPLTKLADKIMKDKWDITTQSADFGNLDIPIFTFGNVKLKEPFEYNKNTGKFHYNGDLNLSNMSEQDLDIITDINKRYYLTAKNIIINIKDLNKNIISWKDENLNNEVILSKKYKTIKSLPLPKEVTGIMAILNFKGDLYKQLKNKINFINILDIRKSDITNKDFGNIKINQIKQ